MALFDEGVRGADRRLPVIDVKTLVAFNFKVVLLF